MTYTSVETEAGETIFRQGERGRYMYLVQEGEVEVVQEVAGEERQVAVLERGDFFGEMALLEEEPRSLTVRALRDARLVKIDGAGLLHLIERNPEVAVRMIRKLRRRLSSVEEMLVEAYAGREDEAEGRPRLVHLLDGAEYPLPDKPETTIGRADPGHEVHPDVDLTPLDPKFASSRRHAKILCDGDGYKLVEVQATNGTFVNGRRLEPGEAAAIESGDEVAFGLVKMRFLAG